MKIDFEISRNYLKDCVQGVLVAANGWRCMTIERPWLNNKVKVSCIPQGTYEYFYRDDGVNGNVLELTHVVNRTVIQVHIGNWVKNSVGCILVGESFKVTPAKEPMVTNSKVTMGRFLKQVPKTGIMRIS